MHAFVYFVCEHCTKGAALGCLNSWSWCCLRQGSQCLWVKGWKSSRGTQLISTSSAGECAVQLFLFQVGALLLATTRSPQALPLLLLTVTKQQQVMHYLKREQVTYFAVAFLELKVERDVHHRSLWNGVGADTTDNSIGEQRAKE